jgi:hypothetical protein
MEISDEMLKTLGESRHLHSSLVPLVGKLLERQILECSLATGITCNSKDQKTVANLNWSALSFTDIRRAASEAPSNGFWLAPIPLPGSQRKWSLGILNITARALRLVCDFTPNPKESQWLSSVSEILPSTARFLIIGSDF